MSISPIILKILSGLFDEKGSLSQKAARSGVWVLSGRFVSRLLTLTRSVVLARLLSPEDFGLFAIALLGLNVLEAFSQTGFEAALIHQHEDEVERYLDTAWVVQLTRCTLLGALLAATAPAIAAFFKMPTATPLLRLVALGLGLRGATNIGLVYLRRDLEFRKQTFLQLATSVADIAVSVTAAVLLRNAVALALGFVAAQLVQLVLSFLIHSYRPRFHFVWSRSRELARYGKWVFSTRLINFLVQTLDTAVIGRMLDAGPLGLYNMASRLSGMAATEVTHVVSQVTFPAFAKVRDDRERLRAGVFRTVGLISTVTLPIAGGLFVLAPQAVRVVLGTQWEPMIPAFQLLLISGAMRSLTANFGSLFLAAGHPEIQSKASVLNLLVLGVSLVPLVGRYGILGAVYGRLLTLVTQLYTWPRFLRLAGVRFSELGRVLASPVTAAGLGVVVVRVLQRRASIGGLAELVVMALVGAVSYIAALWALDRVFSSGHRENFRHVLRLLVERSG